MAFTLRDDQQADVERFLNEPTNAGLNASQVGAGKTLVAVEAARILHPNNTGVKLIIAPLNTFDGWERTITAQTGDQLKFIKNKSTAITDLVNAREGWYFGGWEYMRQFGLSSLDIDFLIGDEVHRARNRKTKSYSMFYHASKAVLLRGGRTMALSATPFGNRPEGAFGVASSLWHGQLAKELKFHAYWPFVDEYMGKHINRWSGVPEANDREYEPGTIARTMPCYWRHAQGVQCCAFHPRGLQEDLPKRVVHQVKVDLSPLQRKLYETLQDQMFVWMKDNDYPIEAGLPPVMHLRLRQICLAVPYTEMAQRIKVDAQSGNRTLIDYITLKYAEDTKGSKLDAVQEILSDFDTGERCVIFTHSAGIITPILERCRRLGIRAERWDGSVPQKDRQAIKNSFIYGSPTYNGQGGTPAHELSPTQTTQVIVAQIGAIGEGVDGLQWACNNEIWYSMDSNGLLNTQAAGRVVRDGQRFAVNSWSLEARGTVEVDQMQSLNRQTRIMDGALNI